MEIKALLEATQTIAVIGLSSDVSRPSHHVADYLMRVGYRVVPVHPSAQEVLGKRVYPTLLDIPATVVVDLVVVFRRKEFVVPHAHEAIQRRVHGLWLQDGVVNEEAALLAHTAGLRVVMDDCILRRHRQLLGFHRGSRE